MKSGPVSALFIEHLTVLHALDCSFSLVLLEHAHMGSGVRLMITKPPQGEPGVYQRVGTSSPGCSQRVKF